MAAEDQIAAILRQASRPGALDVRLVESASDPGRLTWAWGPDGDLLWDDSASYAVLSTILAHKGAYRWDRAFGTLLSLRTRERAATGSQLSGDAQDGLQQVQTAGLIDQGATARAERVATGRWRLRVSWTAAGKPRLQELRI